jgi:serine/threonine protein kinase
MMSGQPPTERHADWADLGGESLGPFKLSDEVARGELASFWRARPLAGEGAAPLVLKRLHKHHARNPEYRAALEREAELLASLRSPNLVPTLRFERTPEPYSVMEFVEGQSLAALLANARRHDAESARFVLPLLVDTLHALETVHGSGLVHQAPVARHILVGVDGRARLVDLTLAMGPSTPRAPLCDHRLQPSEMAPEQVLAPSMVDARADIFILGIALWETLTGQRLFDGKNPLESQRRMLSGTVGAPSEVSRGVHRAFDRVCRRALARPRGERYASAQEMSVELRDEAMRVGAWAEPAEVAAWVRTTMALGRTAPRTAPRTVPRDYARSEAAQTMMGIGGPNPTVLNIADSYRQTQPGSSRGGRRLRSTGSQQSVRHDSTIPIGDTTDSLSASLITRGKPQPPRGPTLGLSDEISVPDLSGLGAGGSSVDDSGYTVRRKAGPSFRMISLALVGVAFAGLGAYVVRSHQNAPRQAQVFVAGPTHEAPAAAAWPPRVESLNEHRRDPSTPVQVAPSSIPSEPTVEASPSPVKAAAPREAAVSPAPAPKVASAPAPKVASAPAPKVAKQALPVGVLPPATPATPATPPSSALPPSTLAPAADARSLDSKRRAPSKPEPSARWDVSSTLGGKDKPSWSTQGSPSWNGAPAAAPAKATKREAPPGTAPADLPINPY